MVAHLFLFRKEIDSMINAVNTNSQTVNPNQPVVYNSTRVKTGCSARYNEGSAFITLVKPGIYKVYFNGTYSSTAAGVATLGISADGVPVTSAQVSNTVADSSLYSSAFSALIQVFPCDSVKVSVTNLSTIPLTVTNPSFTVERLC